MHSSAFYVQNRSAATWLKHTARRKELKKKERQKKKKRKFNRCPGKAWSYQTQIIRNEKTCFVLEDTTDDSRWHQRHHYTLTTARQKHTNEWQDFTGKGVADAERLWVEVQKNKQKKKAPSFFLSTPLTLVLLPTVSAGRSVPAIPEYRFASFFFFFCHRQKLCSDCTRESAVIWLFPLQPH